MHLKVESIWFLSFLIWRRLMILIYSGAQYTELVWILDFKQILLLLLLLLKHGILINLYKTASVVVYQCLSVISLSDRYFKVCVGNIYSEVYSQEAGAG